MYGSVVSPVEAPPFACLSRRNFSNQGRTMAVCEASWTKQFFGWRFPFKPRYRSCYTDDTGLRTWQ